MGSEYLASRIDLNALGSAAMTVTCGSGAAVLTLSAATTSRYYHGDATNNSDDGTVPQQNGTDCLGVILKAALDALALTETFTVTFAPATGYYTITPDSGTIALSFSGAAGARMRRILGFSGNYGAAASAVSNQQPWYWLILPGKTRPTPRRVLPQAFRGSSVIGANGRSVGTGPLTIPYGRSWSCHRIAKAVALNQYATLSEGWTVERFFDYHRTGRRWLHFAEGTTVTSYANREAVYTLTEDGVNGFEPSFHVPHWDALIDIDFDVVEFTAGAGS